MSKQHGFSLIEMTFGLAIIASIVGLGLSMGFTQLDIAQVKSTKSNMTAVREALNLFQTKYNRYPCPAVPGDANTAASYGQEKTDCATDCTGLSCDGNAIIGAVPFKTLRISEKIAYDAWDRKLTYVIDRGHIALSEYDPGTLPVNDVNGNEITASTALGDAVFILISHGEDGKGGYNKSGAIEVACGATTEDDENCDGDIGFTSAQINNGGNQTTTATYYNDWLLWQGQQNVQLSVVPTLAPPPPNYILSHTIMSHNDSTCVIFNDNTLNCSGQDDAGRMGNGSGTGNTTSFVEEANTFGDWVVVRGDNNNTCGIRSSGEAYCWGDGEDGKTGTGSGVDRQTPTIVSGGFTDWVSIDIDQNHGCGVRANGRGYCWGNNTNAELGIGSTGGTYNTPQEVDGSHTDWEMITANSVSCGIRNGGRLYCWGRDYNGQLGIGVVGGPLQPSPAEVNGGFTDWIYVHSTSGPVCGIRATGQLYCWGWNTYGSAGIGNFTTDISVPTEVLGGHTDWEYVNAGNYTVCGIRSGELYCWGRNQNGQLGTGSSGANQHTPQRVGTFDDWRYVGGRGSDYKCGVRAGGELYCWGRNNGGQFGNGGTSGIVAPTQTSGITVLVE